MTEVTVKEILKMHGTFYIHLAQRSREGGSLPPYTFIFVFLLDFPQLKFNLPTCVLRENNCSTFFHLVFYFGFVWTWVSVRDVRRLWSCDRSPSGMSLHCHNYQ